MKRIVGMAVVVAALWAAAGIAWARVWPDVVEQDRPVAVRYVPPTVEIDERLDLDQAEAAAVVERIINDPRGWRTGLGRFTLRIVPPGTRGAGGFNKLVGLAFPEENLAIITSDAWTGVGPKFASVGGTLDQQRTWVVLHELGHLLGHTHTTCPGPGQPAPLMRPKSHEFAPCTLNVWADPDA